MLGRYDQRKELFIAELVTGSEASERGRATPLGLGDDMSAFTDIIYQKLRDKGLPKTALKKYGIWGENLLRPSWETAVKLSNLFGSSPSDWMTIWDNSIQKDENQ